MNSTKFLLFVALVAWTLFATEALSLVRLRPGLSGFSRGLVRASLSRARSLTPPPLEPRQDPALFAGSLAYGLITLPFLLFPLLFLAPLAYARFAPLIHNFNEAVKQIEEPSSPLNDALNALGIGNGTLGSTSSTSKFAQALGLPTSNGISSSAAVASALGEAIFSPGVFSEGLGLATPATYSVKKRPSNVIDVPNFVDTGGEKEKLTSIAKGFFRTISNGLRRYDFESSGCRERLICELNQKVVKSSSLKSWVSAFMDVIETDGTLNKIYDKAGGKNVLLKDIYQGTRSSFTNRDCTELFPNCASSSSSTGS